MDHEWMAQRVYVRWGRQIHRPGDHSLFLQHAVLTKYVRKGGGRERISR